MVLHTHLFSAVSFQLHVCSTCMPAGSFLCSIADDLRAARCSASYLEQPNVCPLAVLAQISNGLPRVTGKDSYSNRGDQPSMKVRVCLHVEVTLASCVPHQKLHQCRLCMHCQNVHRLHGPEPGPMYQQGSPLRSFASATKRLVL